MINVELGKQALFWGSLRSSSKGLLIEKFRENIAINPSHIHEVLGVDVVLYREASPRCELKDRVEDPVELFGVELKLIALFIVNPTVTDIVVTV